MSWFARSVVLILLITGAKSTKTFAQSKYALVIGNSSYYNLAPLKNPMNDAAGMSKVLEDIGFEVDQYQNLTKDGLKEAIKRFGGKAREFDVILFYYAGHGIELFGKNYFVPIDATASSAGDIRKNCVSASAITHYMSLAKSKTNIVILDACRENPFPGLSDNESNDGLALMDAPTGTIISFATAPGKVASDGSGENGLFTEALLTHLPRYDLDIKQVFENVRNTVVKISNNQQIPWESTSLTEEVVLRRKPEVPIQVRIVEGDSVTFEGRGKLHAVSNLKGVSFYWYRNGHQFSNNSITEVKKNGRYQVKGVSREGQVILSEPTNVNIKSFVYPKPYIQEGGEVIFNDRGTLHGKSNVKGKYVWKKDNNLVGEGAKLKVDIPGNYSFTVTTQDGTTATSQVIKVRIK